MASKQIVGDVRVYSRHSKKCPHNGDATHLRCNCWKWIQYQGGKVTRQIPANTRTFAGLKLAAEAKTRELRGEVVAAPVAAGKTLAAAVEEWLAFRNAEKIGNAKATMMLGRLTSFCSEHGVTYLAEFTTNLTTQFYVLMSQRYRNGDSASLKSHWALIAAFFGWMQDEKMLINPLAKRKIKVTKPKLVIPSAEEIQRVIDGAEGMTKLFALTMRYSGMAIVDATLLTKSKMNGNLIEGRRQKTKKPYRVRIPMWLASAIAAIPGERPFNGGGVSAVCHKFANDLRPIFATAGVKMTPHAFRHFFISEQLAAGRTLEDVSHMVGTSPVELLKTYAHELKSGKLRLDEAQSATWLSLGLDADGNPASPSSGTVQ